MWASSSIRRTAGSRANCASSAFSPQAPIPARCGRSPSVHKVSRCFSAPGFDPSGHSGKALMHILEEYPRDELFQIDVDTLNNFVIEILILYERPASGRWRGGQVRSLRLHPHLHSTREIRHQRRIAPSGAGLQGTLSASCIIPFGALARVHYIIGRYEGKTPVVERHARSRISAIAATWADRLKGALPTSTDGMRRACSPTATPRPSRRLYRGLRRNRRSPISRPSKKARRPVRFRFTASRARTIQGASA